MSCSTAQRTSSITARSASSQRRSRSALGTSGHDQRQRSFVRPGCHGSCPVALDSGLHHPRGTPIFKAAPSPHGVSTERQNRRFHVARQSSGRRNCGNVPAGTFPQLREMRVQCWRAAAVPLGLGIPAAWGNPGSTAGGHHRPAQSEPAAEDVDIEQQHTETYMVTLTGSRGPPDTVKDRSLSARAAAP
jgi:hypothetical protein